MFIRRNVCDYGGSNKKSNKNEISSSHSKGLLLNERNELAVFTRVEQKYEYIFEMPASAGSTENTQHNFVVFSVRSMMKSIKYLCLKKKFGAFNITNFFP